MPFPKHEDMPNGTAGVDPLPPLQTEPPAKKEAPLSKTKSTGSNGEAPGRSARVSRQTTPRPDWVDVVPPPPEPEPQEEDEVPTDKAANAAPAEAGLHVSDSSVSKKSLHKVCPVRGCLDVFSHLGLVQERVLQNICPRGC